MVAAALLAVGVVTAVVASVSAAHAGSDPNQAKLDTLRQEAAQRATAYRAPKPADPAAGAPAPTRMPPRTAGIVEAHQAPFSSMEFRVANFWGGPVKGKWLMVFAGGVPAADFTVATGALRRYTGPIDANVGTDITRVGDLAVPGSIGEVRVTAVHGSFATLRDEVGATFTVDLSAHLR